MTEEVNGKVEGEVPTEKTYTAIEQRAMDGGWVPQEEWQGDPDDWRPAKEFVDRGELFKKIEDQSRTIKQFKQTLDAMGKHHAQVREVEYKRALETLKAQKKEALVEGDADAVIDIDEKIALVREEQQELKSTPAPVSQEPTANPILDRWQEKNNWYSRDKAMTAFADALGRELHSEGKSLSDALVEIDKQVKTEFPHKFRNPNKDKPGIVEGSSNRGGKADLSMDLTEEERQVMHKLVKTGVMTKEQYIKDLRAIKGV